MNYIIREINENETAVLEDFLYEAIFVPEGVQPPEKNIIKKPELQVYVAEFGKGPEILAVAEANAQIIGAAWVRIMDDYGHIDNETPSFAISLYKEYRGYGIGTALMKRMLALLRENGYKHGFF